MTTFSVAAPTPALAGRQRADYVVRALTSTRWMVCTLGLAIAAMAYFLLPNEVGRSIYNPMGAGAAVALVTGAGRVASRRTWRSLGTSVFSYAVADTLSSLAPLSDSGAPTTFGTVAAVLYLVSYLVLAVGLAGLCCSIQSSMRSHHS